MTSLRSNESRSRNLLIAIYIVLGFEIVSLASGFLQYMLLLRIEQGEFITEEAVSGNDLREQTIGILHMLAYSASGLLFILWFRRAYANLHTKVNYLSWEHGWAAGSWFVPILNFYRPYQIMKEMYEETAKLFRKKGKDLVKPLNINPLGFWWALWILAMVFGQIVFRLSMQNEFIEDFILTTQLSMINNILSIPLAMITLKIVRDYSEAEAMLPELEEATEVVPESIRY